MFLQYLGLTLGLIRMILCHSRFRKFAFDIAVVNDMCAIPSDIGAIFAGNYANEMAD